jgi:hypothetical protein
VIARIVCPCRDGHILQRLARAARLHHARLECAQILVGELAELVLVELRVPHQHVLRHIDAQ